MTSGSALEASILFSSIASVTGPSGSAAYAAANGALDDYESACAHRGK